MWNSIFVFFLSISGALAMDIFGECIKNTCDNSPLLEGIEGRIPSAEELKALCVPVQERSVCIKNAIKDCTGKSLQELASSDNSTVASYSTLLLNLQSIFFDLCNEDSLLHKGYVSSEACFNNLLELPIPKCHKKAVAIYDAYRESLKLLDEETSFRKMKDADCLVVAYVTACFSLELKDKCGEIARSTFVEILRRTQFLSFGSGACSHDQLQVLRTEYLEFLELDDEKKAWVSDVFNTRK